MHHDRIRSTETGRYVSRLTSGTLAVILAAGRGERLAGLIARRCEPAIPFAGKFRVIDFVLSNCVNSGIRQITVLTEYMAQPLIQHVQRGWDYLRGELGEFVEIVPAQQQQGPQWYQGTADAVFQNLSLIRGHHPRYVLVLGGVHVYKMDYGPLIAAHVANEADITLGVVEVPIEQARGCGVVATDPSGRVTRLIENPEEPEAVAGRGDIARISMGIYLFSLELLERLLTGDAQSELSQHDFGFDILPAAIGRYRVFAYPFQGVASDRRPYWRDIRSVDAFYQANMELVEVEPELNLYDQGWPIWTYQAQHPPAKFVLDEPGRTGLAINSTVAGGCIISGASVSYSLLSSDVRIEENTFINRSVLMPGVSVGRRCDIRNSIIDEACTISDGTRIGHDRPSDESRFFVTPRGVVLVTQDMLKDRP